MLIDDTPSSDGCIGVFSSVKTRPFSALSGDGFGLADDGWKDQRFGHFPTKFLRAEKAGKVEENRVKPWRHRASPRGLPIARWAVKLRCDDRC
jgi:hypothetical protein